MGLSFKEKRDLQKIIQTRLEELKSGSLSFKEKRAAQKELKDSFEKLSVKIDADKGKTENQKLKDLVAGKFNNKNHREFLVILDEIVHEIGELEPVKEPTINYIEANRDKLKKAA